MSFRPVCHSEPGARRRRADEESPSSWRRVAFEEGSLRLSGIQNGGVKRTSDMSSMLKHPALSGRSLSPRAELKKGAAARDATIPESRSLSSFRLVARGVLSVLDGSSVCCSCRSCGRPLRSGCRPWMMDPADRRGSSTSLGAGREDVDSSLRRWRSSGQATRCRSLRMTTSLGARSRPRSAHPTALRRYP